MIGKKQLELSFIIRELNKIAEMRKLGGLNEDQLHTAKEYESFLWEKLEEVDMDAVEAEMFKK